MTEFDFVSGDDFRRALQSDYAELESAMATKAWKSAHLLAGSIVEAILVDYIAGSDLPSKKSLDPLTLDLGAAIKICREEGILSDRAASLSDVVRSYRNLIHPGRAIRLGETVDEQGAQVAVALVDMVAKEVGKSRAEAKGLTAEQLVAKVERDPSSMSILTHLLNEVSAAERTRLLLRLIPDRYLEELNYESPDRELMARLGKAYRTAFDLVPERIKKLAAQEYVRVLREEVQSTVEAWETAFFRAPDLAFLAAKEAAMVKAHLLERLHAVRSHELIETARGIAPYLEGRELQQFADVVVREIVYGVSDELDTAARALLNDALTKAAAPTDQILLARLDSWIPWLKAKGRNEDADKIEQLRASYDLPF